MDAVSVAASIVSLVTIAGQLIQSTKSLHQFWSSVKDVPTYLQWLTEDLKSIQEILESIQQQYIQSINTSEMTRACQALQKCAFHLTNLKNLVEPLYARSSPDGKRKIWGLIKAVFDNSRIQLYRENLEEAKSALIIAQNSSNFKMAGQTRETILAVESGVSRLLANQDNAMSKSTVEYQSIHSSLSSLQQDVQKVVGSLPSILNHPSTDVMTSFENSLSTVIEKKIMERTSSFEVPQSIQQEVLDYRPRVDEKRISSGNVSDLIKVSTDPRPNNLRVKRQSTVSWTNLYTPFGCLTIRIFRIWNIRCSGDEDRFFEARFTFIPWRWLYRQAVFLTGQVGPSDCSLTALNLHFRPIVDSNSAIFKACEDGDVNQVRYLFQKRLASPYAVNPKGEELLLVSIIMLVFICQC